MKAPELARDTSVPETGGLSSYRWLLGVWAVVLAFAVVTAVRSHEVGVPMRDPGGKMFSGRLASALVLLAILAVVDAAVRTFRTRGPVRAVLTTLRTRWTWQRVVVAVSGLLAYHVVYVCYRNMKSWNAFNPLRDDELLRVDRWLFLGHSPAVLLHDLLGQHDAAYALMVTYKAFTYLVPLSVVAALVFLDRIRDGYVFLTSAVWVWILGIVSYYLLPSLGPYAAAPGEFAGLPHTTITDTQAEYLTERAQFLAHPGAADSFVSLGAFASLHVGFTCMVFLMLRFYGFRRVARVMGAYLAVVMLATVYLGWHYVVDDVAGVTLAILSVVLGRWMIYPRHDAGARPAPIGAPNRR
ncbi:MAG: PA-phosphatase [Nocardioides sp.]|jgi:hypothetical protein|nr:PA-phosphatase [Nocardioides sp.]